MVELMPDSRDNFNVRIDELKTLEEVDVSDAELAMRKLDNDNIESLRLSDFKKWPPIRITQTSAGYVVYDGRHRMRAASDDGREEIKATCKPFQSEKDLIEAAFTANLDHGLKADTENRSNYAYWLHKVYPILTQKEIAVRARIKQSTVSIAISRREKGKAQRPTHEPTPEQQRKHTMMTFRNFSRNAAQIFQEVDTLDEEARRALLLEAVNNSDRERLYRFARLMEEVFQPSSSSPPSSPKGKKEK